MCCEIICACKFGKKPEFVIIHVWIQLGFLSLNVPSMLFWMFEFKTALFCCLFISVGPLCDRCVLIVFHRLFRSLFFELTL